jgi:predicted membrane protein
MSSAVQYYRPPRRIPRDESDEQPPRSRTRDLILVLVGVIILFVVLFVLSYLFQQWGLYTIALALHLFTIIILYVSVGVGFAVGLTYFFMRSFLKREFRKRFERMEKARHDQYRKRMGLNEPEDREKK